MNNCHECNKKRVCKHYDYILSNATTFKVTSLICDEYQSSQASPVLKENSAPAPSTTIEDITRIGREFKNYNETTSIKLAGDIEPKLDFKVTAEPTQLVKCFNEECNAETYIEDRALCSKCSQDICPSCSYVHVAYDPKNPEQDVISAFMCESCWSNLDKEEIEGLCPEKKLIEKCGYDISDFLDEDEVTETVELEVEEDKLINSKPKNNKNKKKEK